MKINHSFFVLILLIALSGVFAFSSPAQAALVDIQACDDSLFAGGDGSEGDPWQISTSSELYNVTFCSDDANQGNYFILTDDIDIGGEDFVNMYSSDDDLGWMPIGAYYEESSYGIEGFYGTFDGNHHVISNLYINRDASYQALFAFVEEGSLIYDLGLENVDVTGYAPGAIASTLAGTILTSYVKDVDISATDNDVAGGMVANMYSTSAIEDSYAYDIDVTTTYDAFLGGITGAMGSGAQIIRTYALGSVTLNDSHDYASVGGIAGGWYDVTDLEDSFAVVEITETGEDNPAIGGIVGKWGEPSEEGNNYWYDPEGEDGEEVCIGSNPEYAGGFCTAATSTNQFKNAENEPLASWDIVNTDNDDYEDYNGGYPFLAWEKDGDDAETVWGVFGLVTEEPPQEEKRSHRSGGRSSRSSRSEAPVVVAAAQPAGNTNSNAGISVRDLTLTFTGDDVKMLQEILVAKNTGPAALALKANGTTNYFGPLTQAALAEYQAANGIVPAIGYFGPLTRAQMKAAGVAGLWW